MDLSELATPCLVVDLDRVRQNLARMAKVAGANGVALRPHVKTHKTPALARLQISGGAVGITVSKVSEAEIFAWSGCSDIFVANEVVTDSKARRLVGLTHRAIIRTCVDSVAGAKVLSRAVETAGSDVLGVLIDIDTGLGRAGVVPEDAVTLASIVHRMPGLQVVGVFSYAGYPQRDPDPGQRRSWALHEATTAVDIARQLQHRGINASIVSVAGTCCASFAVEVPGVTEIRPGTYVFGDANYARIGVCSLGDCALRIRATVVSRPTANRAVLDAGSKTLSSEPWQNDQGVAYGYLPELPASRLARLWEEHSVVQLADADSRLQVGEMVDIIPNHVCPVVNLAKRWYGIKGRMVTEVYDVSARASVD